MRLQRNWKNKIKAYKFKILISRYIFKEIRRFFHIVLRLSLNYIPRFLIVSA